MGTAQGIIAYVVLNQFPDETGPNITEDSPLIFYISPDEANNSGPGAEEATTAEVVVQGTPVAFVTSYGMTYDPMTGLLHNPNFDPTAPISGGFIGPQGSIYGYDPITGQPIYNAYPPGYSWNYGASFGYSFSGVPLAGYQTMSVGIATGDWQGSGPMSPPPTRPL